MRHIKQLSRDPGGVTGGVVGVSMYETAPIYESDPAGLLDWAKGAVGGAADYVGGLIDTGKSKVEELAGSVSGYVDTAKSKIGSAIDTGKSYVGGAIDTAKGYTSTVIRDTPISNAVGTVAGAIGGAVGGPVGGVIARDVASPSGGVIGGAFGAVEEKVRQAVEATKSIQVEYEARAHAAEVAAIEDARRKAEERAQQISSGDSSAASRIQTIVGNVQSASGGDGGGFLSRLVVGGAASASDLLTGAFGLSYDPERTEREYWANVRDQERREKEAKEQEMLAPAGGSGGVISTPVQTSAQTPHVVDVRTGVQDGQQQSASFLDQLGAMATGAITAASTFVSPIIFPASAGFRAGMEAAPEILNEIPKLLPDEMSATGIVKSGGDIAAAVIGKGGSELLYKPISALYGVVTGESLDAADRQRMKELQDLYIRDSIYNIYATPGHVVDLATALVDVADETFGSGEFERTHLADDIKRGIFKRDEIGEHVPGSLAGYGTQYDRDVLKYQASDRVGEDYGRIAGFAGDIITMWHDAPVVESVMWTGGKILDLGRFGAPLATTFAVEQVVPAIHDAIFGGPGDAGHDGTVTTVVATPENDELRSAITQYEDATRGYDEEAKKYGDATRGYEEEAKKYDDARAQIERQYARDQAAYERQIADYQRAVEQEQWGLVSEYERQMADYQNQLDREYAQAQDRLLREYEELAGELVEATDEYNAIAREYEEGRAALEEKYLGEVGEYRRGLDEQYQREMEEYQRQVDEYARQADAYQRGLDEQYQREMEEYQRQMEEAEAQREMDYFDAMRAAQEQWYGYGGTGIGTITDQLYSGHSGGGYYDVGGWGTGWVIEPLSDEPTGSGAATEIPPRREINKLAIVGAAGAAILAGAFILTRDRSPAGGVAGEPFNVPR